MNETPERLTEDPLFLACTRPSMFAGVTLEAMFVNLLITGFIFLALGSLLYLLIGVIIHFALREVCRHDPNIFRVWFAWAATKGRTGNLQMWGLPSRSPLSVQRPRNYRQFERSMTR